MQTRGVRDRKNGRVEGDSICLKYRQVKWDGE